MSIGFEVYSNILEFLSIKFTVENKLDIKQYNEIMDDKLGMKSSSNTSIPFKLAFNSLLNKKLINHY